MIFFLGIFQLAISILTILFTFLTVFLLAIAIALFVSFLIIFVVIIFLFSCCARQRRPASGERRLWTGGWFKLFQFIIFCFGFLTLPMKLAMGVGLVRAAMPDVFQVSLFLKSYFRAKQTRVRVSTSTLPLSRFENC